MKKFLLALFLIAALTLALSPAKPAWTEDAPRRIEVTAKRFSFDPGEITLKKGQPVVLVLKSADVGHGLRLRDLGVDVSVKAGATTEAHFTPQKTGDFVAKCSVFCGSGHGTMTLKVHVVE